MGRVLVFAILDRNCAESKHCRVPEVRQARYAGPFLPDRLAASGIVARERESLRMSSFITRFTHIGRYRPRLLAAAAGGLVVVLLLPHDWELVTRALSGWNAGVWAYLASMAWLMLRASPAHVRRIAEQEDASSATVVTIICCAAALSMVAIVLELAGAKSGGGEARAMRYGLTVITVLGSWLLVGAVYTFHYAHMYYQAPEHRRPLRFPEGLDTPDYRDFLYFSFTIAVAAQTSDICVQSRDMRSVVIAQSVLGFFFNVAILGLSINIAAGLVGAR